MAKHASLILLLALTAACSESEAAGPSTTAAPEPGVPPPGESKRPSTAKPAPEVVDAPPPARRPSLNPSAFEAALQAHVKDGRVDYQGLKADAKARGGLATFVRSANKMANDDPLSSWINVYNALVIQEILARYPIQSVMDDEAFFKAKKYDVAGQRMSLDDLENKIIRGRFKDARIHVALNCGAVSCPPLHDRAFVPASLDQDLDALAKAMVADPTHVRLEEGKLHVSALFTWFKDDFERDAGSVQAWIRKYATSPELAAITDETELVEVKYDWRLADAAGR